MVKHLFRHLFWVLIGTIPLRRFLWLPTTHILVGLPKTHAYVEKNFPHSCIKMSWNIYVDSKNIWSNSCSNICSGYSLEPSRSSRFLWLPTTKFWLTTSFPQSYLNVCKYMLINKWLNICLNTCYGYSLEPSRWDGSTDYLQNNHFFFGFGWQLFSNTRIL